jgi:hypothetical protein
LAFSIVLRVSMNDDEVVVEEEEEIGRRGDDKR